MKILAVLVLVALERIVPLRPQKVFRKGLVTDLTHLVVNNFLVTIATIAMVIVAALPLIWIRAFDVESLLPATVAIPLAVVLVSFGNYWGHRLTHRVPFLWRFHSVHHSIEQMDWVASARLHPLDAAFTQGFAILPLFLLGYDAGVFAGGGRVHHAARAVSALERASALSGPAVGDQHTRMAPLASRDRRRRARQELRYPGDRQGLRHRVPAEG